MKLVTMIVLAMSVGLAGIALADGPVGGAIKTGDSVGLVYEGSRDFIEGWNEDQAHADSWTYAALCMGPEWVASTTYTLERIELVGGGIAGTVTIQILADDGSGCPTGEVLSTGTYEQVEEMGWQGCDMEPVVLDGGMTYHMKLEPVNGSPCSFAAEGTIIPHCWSWDCEIWEGPGNSFYWMAKFYGSPPVAEDASTWTAVKAMYK